MHYRFAIIHGTEAFISTRLWHHSAYNMSVTPLISLEKHCRMWLSLTGKTIWPKNLWNIHTFQLFNFKTCKAACRSPITLCCLTFMDESFQNTVMRLCLDHTMLSAQRWQDIINPTQDATWLSLADKSDSVANSISIRCPVTSVTGTVSGTTTKMLHPFTSNCLAFILSVSLDLLDVSV